MDVTVGSIPTVTTVMAGRDLLPPFANGTRLTAVRFVDKYDTNAFGFRLVLEVFFYLAKAPVGELLVCGFSPFLFGMSLHPFGIAYIHIGDALLDAPINKCLGRLVQRIFQLPNTLGQDKLLCPLVSFPTPGTFLALALKFL